MFFIFISQHLINFNNKQKLQLAKKINQFSIFAPTSCAFIILGVWRWSWSRRCWRCTIWRRVLWGIAAAHVLIDHSLIYVIWSVAGDFRCEPDDRLCLILCERRTWEKKLKILKVKLENSVFLTSLRVAMISSITAHAHNPHCNC